MTALATATVTRKAPRTAAAKPAKRKFVRATLNDAPRVDIYKDVTDRIIAQLEAGVMPWARPWKAGVAAPSMPYNFATKRAYSGVNVLLLWIAAMERGTNVNAWLTFKQCADMGGSVRKGERGTSIVFADKFIPSAEKVRAEAAGDDAKAIPFLKRFTVFHVDQCEGLPAMDAVAAPAADHELIAAAQGVIRASGADVRIGGDKAYYAPEPDFIAVPAPEAFFDLVNWNRTALHELTHWTGHSSRLDRKMLNKFGSKCYAREELVAEMGSAFLCASLGIVPSVRHSDYIGNWLTVLREDNRAVFRAASAATKACDFLLSKVEG
jgi:antirestriction protein ArdC